MDCMRADKKNLAAGIREMRSVAKRLMAWAEDLEKNSGTGGVEAAEGAADRDAVAAPDVGVSAGVGIADSAAPSRAEVKGLLAKLCAAGHSAQVKALTISLDEIICRDTKLLGDSEHILRCAKNILTVHATFAALITVELERIIDANQHLISVL